MQIIHSIFLNLWMRYVLMHNAIIRFTVKTTDQLFFKSSLCSSYYNVRD